MTGTGVVTCDDDVDHWYVDFWCPEEEEVFRVYTPDLHQKVSAALS